MRCVMVAPVSSLALDELSGAAPQFLTGLHVAWITESRDGGSRRLAGPDPVAGGLVEREDPELAGAADGSTGAADYFRALGEPVLDVRVQLGLQHSEVVEAFLCLPHAVLVQGAPFPDPEDLVLERHGEGGKL